MDEGFRTADIRRAANLLLDAVSSLDESDDGAQQAHARWLLALEPLDLDIQGSPSLGAALSAAVDLIAFLLMREAAAAGVAREVVVSNAREHLLPAIYPEEH